MKFFQYEDVPLFLGVNGKKGEYIFASDASISVSQPLQVVRNLNDNVISFTDTASKVIGVGVSAYTLGPSGGPPVPLSTSIHNIPSGTKITFPNNKNLFFAKNVYPNGHDFTVDLESYSGFSLNVQEMQSGYFEPSFRYVSNSPVQGTLDVSFYVDSGNLQNFFNITGLSNPSQYPPIDEEKITGHLGDFRFNNAYLNSFNFSLAPNNISTASASFNVYGALTEDAGISSSYYNSSLYDQKSIPHGMTSFIEGTSDHGIDIPVSFSYNIKTNRIPRFEIGTGDHSSSEGLIPTRVAKSNTEITLSIQGERIDPDILSDGFDGKKADVSVTLKDLNYQNFDENTAGVLNKFTCSGVVVSQNLNVASDNYLRGDLTIRQNIS